MKGVIQNLEEMQKIASGFAINLLPKNKGATIVGLYGELGAGKTTFTQAVAKAFGIEEKVISPTFVIEKIYELTSQKFTHLIHIDAYRIEKSEELIHLGWQNIISDPRNLIFIEWPEKISDIMPSHIKINFKHISENSREFEISE